MAPRHSAVRIVRVRPAGLDNEPTGFESVEPRLNARKFGDSKPRSRRVGGLYHANIPILVEPQRVSMQPDKVILL
jgi:hypothetical protein